MSHAASQPAVKLLQFICEPEERVTTHLYEVHSPVDLIRFESCMDDVLIQYLYLHQEYRMIQLLKEKKTPTLG